MSSGGLRVELELDDGSFTSGIIRAGQSIDQFKAQVGQGVQSISKIDESSKGFLSTLRDVTVVAGLAKQAIGMLHEVTTSWASEIIKVNAEFERMNVLMRALSTADNPMKQSVDSVNAIRQMAKDAPFSLNALHDSFTRLNSAGLKPAEGLMHSLVDAVAAFGGTDDVLRRASLAFQEMAGKGVVQMKELRNQLGMAIPNAMKLLARATGESYSDMMSDIHTGTVDAKTAITALQLEFERSFGGAAQEQMKTFNGQLARMAVLAQDIAINHIGKPTTADGLPNKNGFFEVTKKQVADFNGFLESGTAQGLGEMVGKGLIKAVEGFRSLIDTVIEFRHEIMTAAEFMALGFTARVVGKGINSAIEGFSSLRGELQLVTMQYERIKVAHAAYMAQQSIAMAGPMQGPPTAAGTLPKAMSAFSGFSSVAAAALPMVASGVGILLTALPALAAGLGFAAEYFDIFGTKARNAYDDLKHFGASSEEAALKAKGYVDSLNENVRALQEVVDQGKEHQDWLGGVGKNENADHYLEDFRKRLAAAKVEAAEAQEFFNRAIASGKDKDAANDANTWGEKAAEQTRDRQRLYNQASDAAARLYEQQEKLLAQQGKSVGLLKLAYQDDQKRRAISYYEDLIAIQDKAIEESKKLANDGNPHDALTADHVKDNSLSKILELRRQLDMERAREGGLNLNAKPIDDKKTLEKAGAELEKLRSEVEGYAAGIRGADVEAERLAEIWERVKGGKADIPGLAEMIEQMRTLKTEADALNKIFKGGEALDHDLDALILKKREEAFDASHQGMSETDKLIAKVKAGFYDGYGGDTPLQRAMTALRVRTQEVGDQSKMTGAALLEMVGNTLVGQTHTFSGALGEVVDRLQQIKGLSNINVSGNISGLYGAGGPSSGGTFKPGGNDEKQVAASLFEYFTQSGKLNETAAAGVIGNFHQESGLNATLQGGQGSWGMGQWRDSKDDARLSQLKDFAAAMGKDVGDPMLQAAFTLKEMNEKFPGLIARMNMAASPEMAARMFRETFERPRLDVANDPNREGYAAQVYKTKGFKTDGFNPQYKGPKYLGDSQSDIPEVGVDKKEKFDQARIAEQVANAAKGNAALEEQKQKLQELMEKAKGAVDDDGTRYSALVAEIKSTSKNSLGSVANDHDPRAEQYKELIKLAQQLDAEEKKAAEEKKKTTAATNAKSNLEESVKQAQERANNAILRATTKGEGFSEAVERARETAAREADKIKEKFGSASEEYKSAMAQVNAIVAAGQSEELGKYLDGIKKKTRADEDATKTHAQLAEEQLRRDQENFDKLLAKSNLTEEQRAAAIMSQEKYIAAERAKLMEATPFGKQMKEWGDLTQNLQSGVTSWMNSSIDALTTLATTGKANWKSLSQSIVKDLMGMSLKYLTSQLMGGAGGGLGKLFGGAGGAGKLGGGGGSKLKGMFGIAHTGGILGSTMLSSRSGSLLDFIGAPRFHTGGVIGADEVPIIAQKGEGVFTREQMAAIGTRASQGNSGQFAIHNNLTVNASGGTQEQNADLAQQIQQKMEGTMRQTVVSELMKQMRPGNLLNNNMGPGVR